MLGVGRSIDRTDARRRALLDVGEQTRPAGRFMAPVLGVGASANGKCPEQEVERLPNRVCVRVWTEVHDPLASLSARHRRLRPLLICGDRQIRETLVVAQSDVEARLMFLDQRVLEHDGGDIVRSDDPLQGVGCRRHGLRLQRQIGRPVVGEPFSQRSGLAHVEDFAVFIAKQVHTRRVGDLGRRWAANHVLDGTYVRRALRQYESRQSSVLSHQPETSC